ncbi:MAG: hypothetical protein IT384_22550 [Deltaproteobacteria bacterium]|nr:hypothetical protein [Deltaproteobacteria bacterium]
MRRWAVRVGLFALGLGLLILVGWIRFANEAAQRFREGLREDIFSRYERDLRAHVDDWIEDALWLEDLEAAVFRSRGPDAGEYLNRRLLWAGTGVKEWRAGLPTGPHEELSFPEGMRAYLHSRWPRVTLDELKLGEADLSWMRSLLHYQRWDLDHGAPPGWTDLSSDAAKPDLLALLLCAEVRLLQAARDHAEDQAIEEVRHLARLLLTTQRGTAITVAYGLVALEKELTETLGWTVPPLPPDLTALADTPRIARLIRGAASVLNLASPDDVFEGATAKTKGTVAYCLALDEAVQLAAALAPIAEDTPSYAARYARLRTLSTETSCGRERFAQMWARAEDGSSGVLEQAFSPPQRMMLRIAFVVPSTRDAAGEILLSLLLVRGFSGYQETEAARTKAESGGKTMAEGGK